MANKILIKSSGGSGETPTTSECTVAEICVNKRDTKLFLGTGAGDAGTTSTTVHWIGAEIKDEDDMATDGDAKLATQQSIKAYVDGGIGTQLKILPSDFVPNDDSTYYNVAIDDTTASMEVRSTALEVWCFKDIPPGYKATDCKIYANGSRVLKVYEVFLDGSAVPSAITTTGDTDDVIDFSGLTGDVTSTTTNAIALTVITTSTADKIYGGYISIERA